MGQHDPHATHDHDHDHDHDRGRFGWLRELLPFGYGHSHGAANVDTALETSERGILAIKMSIVALGLTTFFKSASSGSGAALAYSPTPCTILWMR